MICRSVRSQIGTCQNVRIVSHDYYLSVTERERGLNMEHAWTAFFNYLHQMSENVLHRHCTTIDQRDQKFIINSELWKWEELSSVGQRVSNSWVNERNAPQLMSNLRRRSDQDLLIKLCSWSGSCFWKPLLFRILVTPGSLQVKKFCI